MTTQPEFEKSLSAVIKQGLTVLVMLILAGLVGGLPGADILLFGRVAIALVLKFGMAVAMAALLFAVHRHAVVVVRCYLDAALVRQPAQPALEASLSKAARYLTLLLYVCLVYWIFIRAFIPLASLLTAASWPFTVIRLCTLALAVAAIIGMLVGASPLFGAVGTLLAGRAVSGAPDPAVSQLKCPACGVLNDEGSKYCRFCGGVVTPGAGRAAAPPDTQTCAKCGAVIIPPARFCAACGKPV